MKNTKFNNSKGLTYIELLVYVAIVSVVMTSLVNFALNIVQLDAKNAVQQDTNTAVRYISERLKYVIRNSNNISTVDSDFGVDLSTNSNFQISLAQDSPNDPTLLRIVDGIMQIKQGASDWTNLNDGNVHITNAVFTNNSSADENTKNITFELTVEYFSPNTGTTYTDVADIRSSAEIRSN